MTTAHAPFPATSDMMARRASPRPMTMRSILAKVLEWQARATERRRLAGLEDRLLTDMGLDRAGAWQESRKPFWLP